MKIFLANLELFMLKKCYTKNLFGSTNTVFIEKQSWLI